MESADFKSKLKHSIWKVEVKECFGVNSPNEKLCLPPECDLNGGLAT